MVWVEFSVVVSEPREGKIKYPFSLCSFIQPNSSLRPSYPPFFSFASLPPSPLFHLSPRVFFKSGAYASFFQTNLTRRSQFNQKHIISLSPWVSIGFCLKPRLQLISTAARHKSFFYVFYFVCALITASYQKQQLGGKE
jgi:hypothetical protein